MPSPSAPKRPRTADSAPPAATCRKTLRFALSIAVDVADGLVLSGGHSAGSSYIFAIKNRDGSDAALPADLPLRLTQLLSSWIAASCKVVKVNKDSAVVEAYLTERGLLSSLALLRSRSLGASPSCNEIALPNGASHYRLATFNLLPSLEQLADFPFHLSCSAVEGQPRLILHIGGSDSPPLQPAIARAFADHRAWAVAHATPSVGALNQLLPFGRSQLDFMLAAEFRQEQKLAEIASLVSSRPAGRRVRVIAIAGPTSSGKTTFSHKLCAYLKNLGIESQPLSVDHYYYELEEQPVFKRTGSRDAINYDSFEAMDVPLFNQHLSQLIAGSTVETPRYNFKTGNRDHPGHTLTLPANAILVMEGIHALNPAYTASVPADMKFTIYISPLSQLTVDDCNAVKTTSWRLLRRMTRDFLFRGHSAEKTLSMWDRVREGEGLWIFPHQNNTDYVMNSCMEYEIPVLKVFTEPLLNAVPSSSPHYERACELLHLLSFFNPISPAKVPQTSLLREFIGDGSFDCH